MQWPLFAGFCVYAYRKFVRYEDAPPPPRTEAAGTEIPAGLLPDRPAAARPSESDGALTAYNAYLAELAEADRARRPTERSGGTGP